MTLKQHKGVPLSWEKKKKKKWKIPAYFDFAQSQLLQEN